MIVVVIIVVVVVVAVVVLVCFPREINTLSKVAHEMGKGRPSLQRCPEAPYSYGKIQKHVRSKVTTTQTILLMSQNAKDATHAVNFAQIALFVLC